MNKQPVKDITGKCFGRLSVIGYAGQNRHRQSMWTCECMCGNILNVARPRLISGNTTSCGCYNKEVISLKPTDAGINRILHAYKQGASKRNIKFDLSRDEFVKLITSDCYYCGESPSSFHKHQYHSGGMFYTGIDRVNSDIGYISKNVVPCCADCNYAKRKMSVQRFVHWINKISESRFFLLHKFGGSHCTLVK